MTPAETLSITAPDGHRFDAGLYRAASTAAPVLIFLSALGTPSRVYRGFASAMAGQGVQVCTPDWRGMASSSVRASRRHDHGYRQLVEIDAPALVDQLTGLFPASRLWIGGHSLGGQLATLIAARQPERFHGLLPIASGSVFLACYPRRLQRGIRLLGMLCAVTGAVVGHFPGQRIGFGGREARGVMKDWVHVAHTGRYEPAGSTFAYEAALAKLAMPVLALNFQGDSWAPEPAASYLLGKLPLCQREQWTWGDAETGGQHLDHFSWTKHPQLLAPRIAAWLQTH
jgi:predicted alpha/beta hydrolase